MKKIIIALAALVAITANAQETNTTTVSEPVQQSVRTTQSVQTNQNAYTAQTAVAPVEEAKPTTLEGVFQQLIDRSGAWQNFKMLDRGKLAAFQRSMTDSINGVRSQLVAEKQKVKENEATIKELNDKITEIQAALDQTKDQKDSVSFFGALVSKGLYNTIMWGIVLALASLLVLYIYKFSNGNVVTKKSINDLNELQEEYENYRKAAIEREQKVRRQLQDEINKHR
jgi:putative secreted protein